MNYQAGELVRSLAGHDTGKVYVILASEGEWVVCCDGKTRPVEKPKKKKCKHVQLIHRDTEWFESRKKTGEIRNEDIIHILSLYHKSKE